MIRMKDSIRRNGWWFADRMPVNPCLCKWDGEGDRLAKTEAVDAPWDALSGGAWTRWRRRWRWRSHGVGVGVGAGVVVGRNQGTDEYWIQKIKERLEAQKSKEHIEKVQRQPYWLVTIFSVLKGAALNPLTQTPISGKEALYLTMHIKVAWTKPLHKHKSKPCRSSSGRKSKIEIGKTEQPITSVCQCSKQSRTQKCPGEPNLPFGRLVSCPSFVLWSKIFSSSVPSDVPVRGPCINLTPVWSLVLYLSHWSKVKAYFYFLGE